MLDPETPLPDNNEPKAAPPTTLYWKPPDLDPSRALPPLAGSRAYRPNAPLPAEAPLVFEEPRRRSRLAGCLWVGITALVIVSLLGTSLLTFFLVRQEAAQSQNQLQAAQTGGVGTTEMLLRDTTAPLSDSVAPPLPTTAWLSSQSVPAGTDVPAINRLVVVNNRGQIETIDPDGTDRQSLTQIADGTRYQFPAWSPDGTAVAAIGATESGAGIYVFDDLSGVTQAEEASRYFSPTQLPIYLYWSPNSDNVAFLANHSRNTFGLNIIASDGAGDSRVVATGSPIYWNWAEDSEILLMHAGETGSEARLVAIDSSGTEQTPNLAEPGLFQAPGISPGGRFWTYAEEAGRGVSTLIVAHTGTGERRLVEQAGSVAMTWSPTAEQLAYTSGGVDAHPYWGPLRIVDAETGDTRLLTRETVLAFFWSPDGRQIAYLTLNNRQGDDVYAANDVRTQRVSRMAQPVQQGGSGFFALSVVNVTTGQGLRLMNFQPTPIFATQFMPFFAQYALSHQMWSPDSSAVVLPVRNDTGDIIMVVPVDGGAPRVVAEGDIAFWSRR
jgi:TolB protein